MHKVVVLFLNGGCASTAILPTEIFSNAGVFWNSLNGEPTTPYFRVSTASLDGQPARTDRLITIGPQCAYRDVSSPDLVFVPAGGLELEEVGRDGYDIDRVIERNLDTVGWLKRWSRQGAQVAAVCSGVALVAEAGLLDGKSATAHWGLADQYRKRFPKVEWRPEYLVTDAGRICCGGGINSAADLALYLVEKFCGRETATRCAKALLIEMPRTWQNAFTHFPMKAPHDDAAVHRAQEWLQRHFSQAVNLEALAADLGMSPRNSARRFKEATGETPLSYLHTLRMAMAKRLLETGRTPIRHVASEVGYADMLFFRKLFKRHAGIGPGEYRKRFGNTSLDAGVK